LAGNRTFSDGHHSWAASGPGRRYWPWQPNVGFFLIADASLRCRELALWAKTCRQPLSGAPAISVALSESRERDVAMGGAGAVGGCVYSILFQRTTVGRL